MLRIPKHLGCDLSLSRTFDRTFKLKLEPSFSLIFCIWFRSDVWAPIVHRNQLKPHYSQAMFSWIYCTTSAQIFDFVGLFRRKITTRSLQMQIPFFSVANLWVVCKYSSPQSHNNISSFAKNRYCIWVYWVAEIDLFVSSGRFKAFSSKD